MATKRIATKECIKCHRRVPANEMRKQIVEKRTGSSIGVYGLGKKGKPRASARSYSRKVEQWTCNECWEAHQAKLTTKIGNFFGYIILAIILIGIAWLILWVGTIIGTEMFCEAYPRDNQIFCSLLEFITELFGF